MPASFLARLARPLFAGLLALAGGRTALAAEPGKAPPFVDVTRDCGLAAIVDDQYAASPKWWLSGLHLVDLDGDGNLDVFLSAHRGGGAVASYYAYAETERHYGLGDRTAVDVEVEFYPSGKGVRVPNVKANGRVKVREAAP